MATPDGRRRSTRQVEKRTRDEESNDDEVEDLDESFLSSYDACESASAAALTPPTSTGSVLKRARVGLSPGTWENALEMAHKGDEDGLRSLPPSLLRTCTGVPGGYLLVHTAAAKGHPACIVALAECGAGATFCNVTDQGNTAAALAASNGHVACLAALAEMGAVAALSMKSGTCDFTPAHNAAQNGHADCLVALAELGATSTFSATTKRGNTPATLAATNGHTECLNVLATHGGPELLTAENTQLCMTPATLAAKYGHAQCLSTIADTCGVAALSAAVGPNAWTPAHYAAKYNKPFCLAVLAERCAASTWAAIAQYKVGLTPLGVAAAHGHIECLDVMVDHGVFGALLHISQDGYTLAHVAAYSGQVKFLERLHQVFAAAAERDRELTSQRVLLPSTVDSASETQMQTQVRLAGRASALGETPVSVALRKGKLDCVQFLARIGGAREMLADISSKPSVLDKSPFRRLLSRPSLLDFACKRAWLQRKLKSVARNAAAAAALHVVSRRGSALEGLCTVLGVDERTGEVASAAGNASSQPRGVSVQFHGEAAIGDGLRREWFDEIVGEIVDVARGLFTSTDGGRTMQPNPHSATVAGADHLSYFALLGRVVGLALYHQEPLDVRWSDAFVKAVLEMPITADDLQSFDPELYTRKVEYLRGCSAEELAALELTFEDDASDGIMGAQEATPLKEGGADIRVTADTLDEYLQKFAEHRLVGAIREQVRAFRNGLGVFVDSELRAQLRQCFTPADFQLLVCGAEKIDVADWQRETQYDGGYTAASPVVVWFWKLVAGMEDSEKSALLHFCTGSSRMPAGGFGTLMGFNGAPRRFTVTRVTGSLDKLPTAATCFNTLRLPEYASSAVLAAKLLTAVHESHGFHEGAVAH